MRSDKTNLKLKMIIFLFLLLIIVFTEVKWMKSEDVYTRQGDKEGQTVTEILAEMSLEEKIGQMVIAGMAGTSLQSNEKELISEYRVGGMIFYANNLETREQTEQLVKNIKEINKENKLPLLISTDQEGGRISRLPGINETPTNKEIGEKNDKEYAFSVGQTLGEQLLAMGFNTNYAPVLDVNSNPENPVIGDRAFGDNADLVSRLGIQVMKGIQSKGIIPVVKHFPGHGDTSVDSHIELPKVNKSLEELNELELIPFKQAIANGIDVVMVAHILLPKLDEEFPASMSETIITDLLRGQLGFQGVVITDDMTMGAVINHYGIGEAAVESVKAGSDLILVAHDDNKVKEVISSLKKAVEGGQISEDSINESVERILGLKNKYLIE
ncbi:beta-N-acetylhexosaminidase [Sediminibacillus massiliensis]|uniref:beta-N-acetylhexosaminidase n=1 Tax=Sediminibacillus massiliensis TaxID=1926277 RepID=UPI0009884FCD|nr:beta-N-acetylhexosaminidase [Sediminibacillus massiliensis]